MSEVICLRDLLNKFEAMIEMPVNPDPDRFHHYCDPNVIIDEDKTVRWNREEVQRRNDEYNAEKDRLRSLYATANENCVNSAKRYIMNELRIDYDGASTVWDKLYSDYHSDGYEEILSHLDEEIDYLSRILYKK